MLYIESIYIAYFITGLLGGFGHCTGMCGPIVFGYTGLFTGKDNGMESIRIHRSRWEYIRFMLLHLYYNLGRTTTYVFLGGVVSAGVSFLGLFKIHFLQKIVMIITAIMMILAGLITGDFIHIKKPALKGIDNMIIRIMKNLRRQYSPGILFPFGIIMGFLPCGLLYTALIGVSRVAVDEKNTFIALLKGITLMGIFGLSTSVALIITGLVSKTLFIKARKGLYRSAATLMVVLGCIFLWRAIQAFR